MEIPDLGSKWDEDTKAGCILSWAGLVLFGIKLLLDSHYFQIYREKSNIEAAPVQNLFDTILKLYMKENVYILVTEEDNLRVAKTFSKRESDTIIS